MKVFPFFHMKASVAGEKDGRGGSRTLLFPKRKEARSQVDGRPDIEAGYKNELGGACHGGRQPSPDSEGGLRGECGSFSLILFIKNTDPPPKNHFDLVLNRFFMSRNGVRLAMRRR